MAQSKSEQFVRLYWKNVETHFRDGDSYGADIWSVDLGAKHIWNSDHKHMWDEAADYTRMRLRTIEEVEEQYFWLMEYTEDAVHTQEQERARKTLINDMSLKLDALKMELYI